MLPENMKASFHDYINDKVFDFSECYCEFGHLEKPIDINNCFTSLTNLFNTVSSFKQ